MKLIFGIAAVVTLGLFAYDNLASKQHSNNHYVIMEFRSGNTAALSEKYADYDACITSPEYKFHSIASSSNIKCTNKTPTYR